MSMEYYDAGMAELRARLEQYTTRIAELDAEIERLEAEIAEKDKALEKLNTKPATVNNYHIHNHICNANHVKEEDLLKAARDYAKRLYALQFKPTKKESEGNP